jgi:hypothetical protein
MSARIIIQGYQRSTALTFHALQFFKNAITAKKKFICWNSSQLYLYTGGCQKGRAPLPDTKITKLIHDMHVPYVVKGLHDIWDVKGISLLRTKHLIGNVIFMPGSPSHAEMLRFLKRVTNWAIKIAFDSNKIWVHFWQTALHCPGWYLVI